MLRQRRWLAVLCIFALIAAALFATAPGGPTSAGILVPLPPLFGLVVIAAVTISDAPAPSPFVAASPLPSRAPPSRPLSAS